MLEKSTFLTADYGNFKCVGTKNCQLSCCHNNPFVVTKKDKSNINKAVDGNQELMLKSQLAFGPVVDGRDMLIRLNPNSGNCWFVNDSGGCDVYHCLPSKCYEYPMVYRNIDSQYQKFLSPSCPEVGDLLFNKEGMLNFLLLEDGTQTHCSSVEHNNQAFMAIREFGAMLLQTFELSLSHRMMILAFTLDAVSESYEKNNVSETLSILDTIRILIESQDDSIMFEQVTKNDNLHALLLIKLLQIRHDKHLNSSQYDYLLFDLVNAFDLSDTSISIEDRALKAIPHISSSILDLEISLQRSPYFLDNILLNHWVMYAFPNCYSGGIKNNAIAFFLFFLIQRMFLAVTASSSANDFSSNASKSVALVYREWVDDSPILPAAAASIAKSELNQVGAILSLLKL